MGMMWLMRYSLDMSESSDASQSQSALGRLSATGIKSTRHRYNYIRLPSLRMLALVRLSRPRVPPQLTLVPPLATSTLPLVSCSQYLHNLFIAFKSNTQGPSSGTNDSSSSYTTSISATHSISANDSFYFTSCSSSIRERSGQDEAKTRLRVHCFSPKRNSLASLDIHPLHHGVLFVSPVVPNEGIPLVHVSCHTDGQPARLPSWSHCSSEG